MSDWTQRFDGSWTDSLLPSYDPPAETCACCDGEAEPGSSLCAACQHEKEEELA